MTTVTTGTRSPGVPLRAMGSTIWHSALADFVPRPSFIDEEILAVAARPARPAICEAAGNGRITFGQIADGSRRLAAGLAERGIGRGDVVSIVAANHPDFAVALYGSLAAGAAVAVANPCLTSSELAASCC
jgi:acyl-CoA synthetase (AMP-forming)/AMP-acid ligase II